jgi:aminomethyltransferase
MERESPLLSWHRGAGAKMVDFHGWQMPLSYGRISEEVLATRERVGLFDLCHMGRVHIRGGDRVSYLDRVFTGQVADMEEGQVKYGFLCNEDGGVIDDVTVYREEDYLMLVVNAANLDAVLPWLERQRDRAESVQIENKTVTLSMFAIQGPWAVEIMDQLSSQRVSDLKYYTFTLARVLGNLCLISRTGYTGEDGFEIYLGRANAEAIWAALLRAAEHVGGVPVGLAARDTLRLEAGFPLHGQELSPKITPIEAGLDKFIAFEKRQFIGRTRLLDSTSSEFSVRLVGFEMIGQAIPRTGYPLCHQGVECGHVTSGGFSPTLDKAIGMGFVEQMHSGMGQVIEVRIRGKQHPATVVRRPFYKRKKKSAS